jgi:hypothetical protein
LVDHGMADNQCNCHSNESLDVIDWQSRRSGAAHLGPPRSRAACDRVIIEAAGDIDGARRSQRRCPVTRGWRIDRTLRDASHPRAGGRETIAP